MKEELEKGIERVAREALVEAEKKLGKKLTHKQRGYVLDTARGKKKATAYRDNYDVVSTNANAIANSAQFNLERHAYIPIIRSYIEEAIDNFKLYTSSEMYALVADQYQKIALNQIDATPAQLAALAMMAKEYGYGVERKLVQVHHSSDKQQLKAQLLEKLRTIDEDKS